ncbi:hypothetical protein Glove_362g73 [Diversispora epigaea]|uniref:SAM domain-containing protein n=1 Tax=Diversispora epigaea TaxID=1348612 RepID=A0A397HDL2_9GLOM|nr:hypothetical protein Glove_362g73 [Diversispora epigaea]
MSEQSTPAFTSTTTEEKPAPTLAEVRKYKTNELTDFLRKEGDLELEEDDLEILRKQRISGHDFFKLTKKEYIQCGMKIGPATRLVDFAKEVKKSRAYSLYKNSKDLERVLKKFGIDGKEIGDIPPFKPETVKIEDDDEKFQYCINYIKFEMINIGSETGSNEALRCEYISTILHASLHIARRFTEKKIVLKPQLEIVGDEATGRVDYVIKKLEEVLDAKYKELIRITEGKQSELAKGYMQNIMQLDSSYRINKKKQTASEAFDDKFDYLYGIVSSATDWHFIMYTPEKIYCTKATYNVPLTEDILEDDTELRRNLKKVMEVIVGLLKDRINVDDSPASKRARMEKYIKKQK